MTSTASQLHTLNLLPDVMPTKMVAEFFYRTARTIQEWRKAGLIRPLPNTGNRLWSKNEVERRLKQITPAKIY